MKRFAARLIIWCLLSNQLLSMSTAAAFLLLSKYCSSPAATFRHHLSLIRHRSHLQQCPKMKTITDWTFCQPNILVETFPLDHIKDNYVRRVPRSVFSPVTPDALKTELKLISASDDVLENILDMEQSVKSDPQFAQFVAGNLLLPGSQPMAHRYGGYQFGYWADQLGDGRAILLGDYVNRKGERWELQLKGAGKTPYSRNGDGRAVLRSSIREFLCSEAMHALGIPTTRAAALALSQDMVVRDQFYNGRMKLEPCAVVLRLAPSWFRIGSLEILSREKETDILKQMVDFVMRHNYAHIASGDYVTFFSTVVNESASLVAHWMAVGFAHGVLNTDNMSLLSVTIDYGPFGFLDAYEPTFIPNHSDDEGRYSYENQPKIFKWNLSRLAVALDPILNEEQKLQMPLIMGRFDAIYREHFQLLFSRKLGLRPVDGVARLIQLLLDMMEQKRADFTQTFRQLGQIDLLQETDYSNYWALKLIADHRNFAEFLTLYRQLVTSDAESEVQRRATMNTSNPQYVLRNWMAEFAIRKAQLDNDYEPIQHLLHLLQNPYNVDPKAEVLGYSKPPPSWACTLRVSCSS